MLLTAKVHWTICLFARDLSRRGDLPSLRSCCECYLSVVNVIFLCECYLSIVGMLKLREFFRLLEEVVVQVAYNLVKFLSINHKTDIHK